MAMDHSGCTHPRTPAGRAACRKARANGSQPAAEATTTPARTDPVGRLLKDLAPATRSALRTTAKSLKKANTRIRTEGDLADVPMVMTPAIRSAWDRGWTVRVGDPYNERERRVLIDGPNGEIALVWNTSNPNGLHGWFFRPKGSSVTHRTLSVGEAFDQAG